tara:strand:+ start:1003 stop:2010 length:1008 start_codon:yes stop_codon:yes gene_type:complete
MKLLYKNDRLILETEDPDATKPAKINIARQRHFSQAPSKKSFNEVGQHNLDYLFDNYEFQSILKRASGNAWGPAFKQEEKVGYTSQFISEVPLLTQAKITNTLGMGAFGAAYSLDNGHVIKIYYASFEPEKGSIDIGADRDRKRYEDLYDKAFSGKGAKEDLMIFDQNIAFIGDNWFLHWAEMPRLMPLANIYGDRRKHAEEYRDLGEDISFIKELAIVFYARQVLRKKRKDEGIENPEDYDEPLEVHGFIVWTLNVPLNRLDGIIEIEDVFELNSLTKIFEKDLVKMEHVMAKKLLTSIWKIIKKEGIGAIKDIRLMNVGVLEQDPTTPVIFDY